MIRVNLLPPELRKRRATGISPVFLSVVGGGALALAVGAFYAWIVLSRIPYAEEQVADWTEKLAAAKKEENRVRDMEKKLQGLNNRLATLQQLVDRKMWWAEVLDDFADLIGRDDWGDGRESAFRIGCLSLSVSQSRGGGGRGAAGQETARFTWNYQLVGDDFRYAGEYINRFFKTVEQSDFWKEHGFQDKPVDTYRGDTPQYIEDIAKVLIQGSLTFERVHQPGAN